MERLLEPFTLRLQRLLADVDVDCESLKLGSIAAIVSVVALYVGYLYLSSLAEAPVTFNVPLPEQLKPEWNGVNWGDLQGHDRKILEGQIKGVSLPSPLNVDIPKVLINIHE
jgi:hypothetical protein